MRGLLKSRPTLVTLAIAIVLGACKPGEGMVAYVGGNLWDGTGAPPVLDAVILVNGSRVELAGPPDLVKVPRGAEVHRLDGKWIIPGLIDAHAHLEEWMLRPMLAYGVTTVRDGGGDPDSVYQMRDRLNLGAILGPRFFVAGAPIDAPPPSVPTVQTVRTPVEARRAVDQRRLDDATHAIIYPKITRTMLRALLDEAKVLHLPIGAHLGKVDALTAAREGISSIEYLSGIVEATVANPAAYIQAHDDFYRGWKTFLRGWAALDSASLDRTARALAETKVAVVPTLAYSEAFSNLENQPFIDDLDLSTVPPEVSSHWDIPGLVRRAGLTANDYLTFQRGQPMRALFLRRFHAAGGLVAAGSHAPYPLLAPGASLHEELRQLVRAGFSPREALLMATREGARLLEAADSLGVVRDGGVADFIILNQNPLDDIANVKTIEFVVFRGIRYARQDLLQ
jgi:imidazolonepropionase-like amidohydrolase